MIATFDLLKDLANQKKHGVSLAFGGRILEDPHALVALDLRFDYGEDRLVALGMVEGAVWVCVYVEVCDDQARIISVRKATRDERNDYYTAPR